MSAALSTEASYNRQPWDVDFLHVHTNRLADLFVQVCMKWTMERVDATVLLIGILGFLG